MLRIHLSLRINMGFGVSVIQRLCKTSVKKNLYWEVKDKIVEEAFNGIRSVKRSQRVRVYGLDSTKDIRARLIEILYDRVALHKDKFIAPILHAEMQSMEVKKNGKVEHSKNSHDDQVFSYLMALYVWYDGKNLAENFHIIKNTIRTDQDEELEDLDIEDNIESIAKLDIDEMQFDPDSEISQTLEFIKAQSQLVTSDDLKTQQYLQEVEMRNIILATNKDARESYAKKTGVDPAMYSNQEAATYVNLPDSLFMDTDILFGDEDKEYNPVQGNLADIWGKI